MRSPSNKRFQGPLHSPSQNDSSIGLAVFARPVPHSPYIGYCITQYVLSHYVTETSHLNSLRDFWRHFGLCRAAAHSDWCFFAPCINILTYLLTKIAYGPPSIVRGCIWADPSHHPKRHRDRHRHFSTIHARYQRKDRHRRTRLCLSDTRRNCLKTSKCYANNVTRWNYAQH